MKKGKKQPDQKLFDQSHDGVWQTTFGDHPQVRCENCFYLRSWKVRFVHQRAVYQHPFHAESGRSRCRFGHRLPTLQAIG